MKKRNRILLGALVVAVVGGLAWVGLREPPEPVYQGKKLSIWLWLDGYRLYFHGTPGEEVVIEKEEHATDEVIRQFGTNAIPTLFRMLNATDSPYRKLAYIVEEHTSHRFKFSSSPAFAQNYDAALAFRALGVDARNAVPGLIDIYNRNQHEGSQELAAFALGGIGPPASNAVPSLLRTVTNVGAFVPPYRLGSSGAPYNALRALGEIHAEPEKVVPVLVKYLKDPDVNVRRRAVLDLQDFGGDARQAAPALVGSLADSNDFVRKAATNALKQIDPVAASKAGVK